jgi:hypothetical protein
MKSIILTSLLFLCLAQPGLQAQKTTTKPVASKSAASTTAIGDTISQAFAVVSKVKSNSIIVRWAPANYSTWMLANTTGYVLERAESDQPLGEGADVGKLTFQRVNGFPMKPYTKAEWDAKADTTNLYVVTAGTALLKASVPSGVGMELLRNMNSQQEMRHAMAMLAADLNTQAATGLALRYEDQSVVAGKYYAYRVFCMPSKKGILTDTAYTFAHAGTPAEMYPVQGVFVENAHNQVIVGWNMPVNSPYFTGYHIERADGNGQFKRLTSLPIVCSQREAESNDCSYIDSTVVNGKKYQYRMIGLDAFADEGAPSNVIDAEPVDQFGPPPADNIEIAESGKGGFIIKWEGDHSSTDHGGWWVGRAANATGPFILLQEKPLSKQTRQFTDENPIPLIANYYVVYSTDIHGNKNISNPNAAVRTDSIPPAKPQNLHGLIDSNGVVTINWDLGTEVDLFAYRVFRANSADREFYQVTSDLAGANYYTDKIDLNTTSEEIYYKIVALDFHYNPSVHSEVLVLKLPDTIAPAAALITGFEFTPKGVHLQWAPSSSADATQYNVWRKTNAEGWKIIYTSADPNTMHYDDNAVAWNTDYMYALETIDDAGLSAGRNKEVKISTPVRASGSSISNVRGTFDNESKQYIIEWAYDGPAPAKFVVYRSVDDQPMEYFGEVKGTERSFVDERFYKTEKGYAYMVNALYTDGTSTSLEAPFVVEVKR